MALSDKKLLEEFELKAQRIAESTVQGVNPLESEADKQKRIAGLLKDYEAFCLYYFFPYISGNKLSAFQKQAANYIDRHKFTIYLAQWSREFGKTVHFNCFIPLYKYFNGKLTGMIAGSASEDLAMRILFDVKANLEHNFRLRNDFSDRRSLGNWSEDGFVTKDGVQFLPFGVGQTPRGTRFGKNRPNYGTVDDINDKKSLKNDAISQEIYEWVKEDFMGALSTNDWTLVVPQNKFHRNTITAKFEEDKEIKGVKTHRVNMLSEKGASNFPEYLTTEACQSKISAAGYFSSQREFFNNPIEEGKIFKEEHMLWGRRHDWRHYDAIVGYADPSYKNNQKSDYKAVVLVGKKGSRYMVFRSRIDKVDIPTMFRWHYSFDELVGDNALIQHWMEASFIQDMHLKALDPLQEEYNRRLRAMGDERAKPDKFQRVSSLEPLFTNGLIEFDETQKTDPGMILLRRQLGAFEKGSNINDDGPDALEGAIYKLDEITRTSKPTEAVPRRKSKFAY